MKAMDCRAEADGKAALEREGRGKGGGDRGGKGLSSAEGPEIGEGFVSHFPRPKGRAELDGIVARDQQGLWSLDKPTGVPSRLEKVVAKKWGVDCDVERWTDGTRKEQFLTTFFKGTKPGSDDFLRMDKKAEGDAKREALEKERLERKKYKGGRFPKEVEEDERRRAQSSKPQMRLDFPRLEKDRGVGTGELIKMLGAVNEKDLERTKWKTPEPFDFECDPGRPGKARMVRDQKVAVEARQRARRDRLAKAEDDDMFDELEAQEGEGEEEEEGPGGEEFGSPARSVMSSVTVIRSEYSMGANLE